MINKNTCNKKEHKRQYKDNIDICMDSQEKKVYCTICGELLGEFI